MQERNRLKMQHRKLLACFDKISPEKREWFLNEIQKASEVYHEPLTADKRTSDGLRIIEEWTDEEGNIFRTVEADDGLTPQQRTAQIAEILAKIALRVMKQQQQEEKDMPH